MHKLYLLLLVSCFVACNNSTTVDTKKSSLVEAPGVSKDSLEREGEMNFIDACVESSKESLGEKKAFELCKCIYPQARAKYAQMDSTSFDALARDTAEIAKMAANCK